MLENKNRSLTHKTIVLFVGLLLFSVMSVYGGQTNYKGTPLNPAAYKIFENNSNLLAIAKSIGREDANLVDDMIYPENRMPRSSAGYNYSEFELDKEDYQDVRYWLLSRLYNNDTKYSKMEYNSLFEGEGMMKGIKPTPNTGTFFVARAMTTNHTNSREEDLLRGLYLFAAGSSNGAEPIINGSYMRMRNVQDKVREWKEKHNFAPYSNQGNHLLAYVLNTMRDTKIKNSISTSLTLDLIGDYYDSLNKQELQKIFSGRVSYDLISKKKIPDFDINNKRVINIF